MSTKQVSIKNTVIYGIGVTSQAQCTHYHSALDVIAILFKCCQRFFACYQCHQAAADHSPEIWQQQEFDVEALLCGGCGNKVTISAYLTCQYQCPYCQISFNPGCHKHHALYFQTETL